MTFYVDLYLYSYHLNSSGTCRGGTDVSFPASREMVQSRPRH